MSLDPCTLLCDVTAHTLYINGPFADTKKTLPQYCCVVRVLERPTGLLPSKALSESVTIYTKNKVKN
jgi:hypothetical protein